MNGAHALLRTLVDNGVTTCFTNPGTSEMHFVAALDDVPEMRAVLTLFEGVATGAALGSGSVIGKFKDPTDKLGMRCVCGAIGGIAGGVLLSHLPALTTLGGVGFGVAIGGVAAYAVGSVFATLNNDKG